MRTAQLDKWDNGRKENAVPCLGPVGLDWIATMLF